MNHLIINPFFSDFFSDIGEKFRTTKIFIGTGSNGIGRQTKSVRYTGEDLVSEPKVSIFVLFQIN